MTLCRLLPLLLLLLLFRSLHDQPGRHTESDVATRRKAAEAEAKRKVMQIECFRRMEARFKISLLLPVYCTGFRFGSDLVPSLLLAGNNKILGSTPPPHPFSPSSPKNCTARTRDPLKIRKRSRKKKEKVSDHIFGPVAPP